MFFMVCVVMKNSVKMSKLSLLSFRVPGTSMFLEMITTCPPKSFGVAHFSIAIPFPALRKKDVVSFPLILVSPTGVEVGGEEKHRPLFPPTVVQ